MSALPSSDLVIGIDLGTTTSTVAYINEKGQPVLFTDSYSKRIVDSCVYFPKSGPPIAGTEAFAKLSSQPKNTVNLVKRFMGRSYNDPGVAEDIKMCGYQVTNQENKIVVEIPQDDGKVSYHEPQQISAHILTHMKRMAEKSLGKTVDKAVITIPAYFSEPQRKATKDAGIISGFKEVHLLNEPTAAALAFGLDKKGKTHMYVIVFDLGGGTFDVTLLSIDKTNNLDGDYVVKGIAGDNRLGGMDFDNQLLLYVLPKFEEQCNSKISENPKIMARLKNEVQAAKKRLTDSDVVTISLEINDTEYTVDVSVQKFNDLNALHFQKTIECLKNLLKDASVDKSEIDEIVMIGGSSRICQINKIVQDFFGGKTLNRTIQPDEAVGIGAAIKANMMTNKPSFNPRLTDVVALSLGIEVDGGEFSKLIPANSIIPFTKTKEYCTKDDFQTELLVQIFEGERAHTKHARYLGECAITVPPLPKRKAKIDVTFHLTEDGILKVHVLDKTGGKTTSVTIQHGSNRLSDSEIQRMIEEHKKYQQSDELYAKRMRAKLSFENYCDDAVNEISNLIASGSLPNEALETYLLSIKTFILAKKQKLSHVSDENVEMEYKNAEEELRERARTFIQSIRTYDDDKDDGADDDDDDDIDDDMNVNGEKMTSSEKIEESPQKRKANNEQEQPEPKKQKHDDVENRNSQP